MANVTSSGNTTIKPTISAAKFMGASHAAGSSLENQIQTIRNLVFDNMMGISSIKSVISSIESVLDSETLKVSNLESKVGGHEKALEETNSILTDIGNALALDFANRIAASKDAISNIKEQKSKGKFGRAEDRLEGKEKKIGSIFKNTESKAASPVQGLFGKILSFIRLIGTGIGLNFASKWLQNPANMKKLVKVGEFITNNWKLIAGVIVGGGLLIGLGGILGTLFSVFAILTNPIFLTLLGLGAVLGGGALLLNQNKPDGPKKEIVPMGKNKDFGYKQSNWNAGDFANEYLLGIPPGGKLDKDIPKMRNGGIVDGPKSGYPAILHGREMVIPLEKLSQNPRRQPKITTITMPPIVKGSVPKGESNVATAVPNIPSANPTDPYRQLTPNIYGIYV